MKQNDRLSRIRQKQRLEGQHFQNPFYTCAGNTGVSQQPLAAAAAVRPRKVGTHETPRQLWREKGKRRKRNVDREEEEEKKTTTSCCCCTAHGGGPAPRVPYYYCCVCVWVYSNIWSLKKRVESKTRWRFFIFPTERRLVVYLSCTFSLFVWSVGYCQYWIMRPALFTKNWRLWRPSKREWKGAIFKTTNIGAHSITLLLKYCVAARSNSKANRAKVVGYTRRTLLLAPWVVVRSKE